MKSTWKIAGICCGVLILLYSGYYLSLYVVSENGGATVLELLVSEKGQTERTSGISTDTKVPMSQQDVIVQNTMKETSVHIQKNESVTIDALTIVNNGGGHEMSKTGDDDSIFTELTLSADQIEAQKVILHYPYKDGLELQVMTFGEYEITVEAIEWNGESVDLTVRMK